MRFHDIGLYPAVLQLIWTHGDYLAQQVFELVLQLQPSCWTFQHHSTASKRIRDPTSAIAIPQSNGSARSLKLRHRECCFDSQRNLCFLTICLTSDLVIFRCFGLFFDRPDSGFAEYCWMFAETLQDRSHLCMSFISLQIQVTRTQRLKDGYDWEAKGSGL